MAMLFMFGKTPREETGLQGQTRLPPGGIEQGRGGAGRCDMKPSIEVCVYCSHKIEEKEKSVNLPAGVAHLACAQKVTIRTKS